MLLDTLSLLVTINEVDWLVTNRTVADMEDKLPREERLEWARQMCTAGGDTRFEKFKNFLQMRKSVLENVELMGSKGGGDYGRENIGTTGCSYCGKPGHSEDRCFSKQRDTGGQGQGGGKGFPAGGRGGCAICQSQEHWKNECPDLGTFMDKKFAKKGGSSNSTRGGRGGGQGGGANGGGANGGGGGGTAAADVGSNTLRAVECPRCKASSKLSFCAGCKASSSITHCLLHCEGFMVLSVKDRADIVKTAKACAICLHPSHTADRCCNKDKDKAALF